MTNEIKIVPVSELIPDPDNANLGSERGLAMLQSSLQESGAGRSILVDKNGVVIAGNKTLESAADIGITDVIMVPSDGTRLIAVVRTDLDLKDPADLRARKLALADNRVGQIDLVWSPETLLELSQVYGEDLTEGLWSPDEWRNLVLANAEPKERGGPRQSDTGALQESWGTEPGQVWLIPSQTLPGKYHRLMCADSLDPTQIDLVMAGRLANLMITSPPYWVGMEYETQRTESEIDQFIARSVGAWAGSVSRDWGRVVINTGTASIHRIEKRRPVELINLIERWQQALKDYGWLLRHLRIWAKSSGSLRGVSGTLAPVTDAVDMAHEHLATFSHETEDSKLDQIDPKDLVDPWGPGPENSIDLAQSDWSYMATWWNPQGEHRGQEKIGQPWAQQGVWADIAGDAGADGLHVAAFPIEIPRRFILLYTKPGEVVLDPFSGSGTTILAAEITGRLGVGIEMHPGYLAAALQRFSDSGLEPRQEES